MGGTIYAVLLAAAAGYGAATAAIGSWPYGPGQHVVLIRAARRGESCGYVVRFRNCVAAGLVGPWPCDQPRVRFVTQLDHSAGDWPEFPVEPGRTGSRGWSLLDFAGYGEGPATVPVSADGTVPFLESGVRRARRAPVRIRQVGVQYETAQRKLAFPAVAWAVWTVALLGGRIRRLRRAKAGCCATCGYDLRASKDRCPECGTPTTERPWSTRLIDVLPVLRRRVLAYLGSF